MFNFLSITIITFFVLLISPPAFASDEFERLINKASLDADANLAQQAAQLTHYLEQNGYILATAEITKDGKLVVHSGHVTNIVITGLSAANEEHARSIIENAISEKTTEETLDRALSLVNDMPGVSATFAIERDKERQYEIYVSGEQILQNGRISLENTPRKIGKESKVNLSQNFNGLITGGDILRLQAVWAGGVSEPDQTSVLGSYQIPVASDGAYLEFGAGDYRTETEVHSRNQSYRTGFGSTISPGTVTSSDFEGQSLYVTAGYPLLRRHDKAFYLIGQIDYTDDTTDRIGETTVIHGDVGFYSSFQYPDGQSFHVGGYIGMGHNDSYIQNEDNGYWSAELASAYITPLPSIDPYTELRIEGLGKIAGDDLPNSKLFGLGAEDFLRGYKTSTYVGTSGGLVTTELAHAYYFKNEYLSRVSPYVFLDAGFVRSSSNKSNTTNRPDSKGLASMGIGSGFVFAHGLSADGFVGVPLIKDSSDNLPGPALFVRLNWSW
jgi:hemolysin activation/secretion protein